MLLVLQPIQCEVTHQKKEYMVDLLIVTFQRISCDGQHLTLSQHRWPIFFFQTVPERTKIILELYIQCALTWNEHTTCFLCRQLYLCEKSPQQTTSEKYLQQKYVEDD